VLAGHCLFLYVHFQMLLERLQLLVSRIYHQLNLQSAVMTARSVILIVFNVQYVSKDLWVVHPLTCQNLVHNIRL